MATPVVFVLCCNLLWISFHNDKSRVEGHEDSRNTTMLPWNISMQLPISVAGLDKPEVVHSGQGLKIPDLHLSKSSDSGQKIDTSRSVSQLFKVNHRHLPLSGVNGKRVSVGKALGHFEMSTRQQGQRFSTPSAVVSSTRNKLYYVGNTTGQNQLIFEGGDKHNFSNIRHDKKSSQAGVRKPIVNVRIPGPKVKSRLGSYTETPKLEHKRVIDRGPFTNITNVDGKRTGVNSDLLDSSLDNRTIEPDARINADSLDLLDKTGTENTIQSKTSQTSTKMNDVNMQSNGSAWTEWGPCSVSCGTGTQERSRACGANCQQVESRECYLDSCHGIMRGVNFSDVYVKQEFDSDDTTPSHSEVPTETYLDTVDTDACEMWSTCKDEYLQRYMTRLNELANCPCFYPYNLENNNNVWDDNRRRYYQWVEVNSTAEKLSVYRPGAYKCIRSLLFPGATTLAAQVCCYTNNLQLVTRGRNAGTPNLISPQISWELHYKIDILPWVICKGDWTRYNRVLSPNNMLGCAEFPDEDQLLEEVKEARDY